MTALNAVDPADGAPGALSAEALIALIKSRRSVRRFRPEPVERATIERLIEVATWAPTAGNRQDWEFTAVYPEALRLQMAEAAQRQWETMLADAGAEAVAEEFKRFARSFDWFARAPVVLAVSARRPEGFLYYLVGEAAVDIGGIKTSAAMAAQTLMLTAHALGLATCCLSGPLAAHEPLRELLGLPEQSMLVCLIALGWPAEEPACPGRKPVSEVLRIIE